MTQYYIIRGAGMTQWWERSPPTNVSQVRFPDPASYVSWVCCWFSSLLRGFSSLHKNQHFLILIRSGNSGWRATSWKCHCKFPFILFIIVLSLFPWWPIPSLIVHARNHGSNVVVFIKANVQFEVMNTTTLISNRGHWPLWVRQKTRFKLFAVQIVCH